jgi:hypothetical protein
MIGYVRRINAATLNVAIGGVRIGAAKYSRLAQINLKSRIITFSRYAIENVAERGRRYLVIHELAHVLEPSHNRRFWDIVARYEPDYAAIDRDLELAFRRNVEKQERKPRSFESADALYGGTQRKRKAQKEDEEVIIRPKSDVYEDWDDGEQGIICGGFESTEPLFP